jgi:hypothetical protein
MLDDLIRRRFDELALSGSQIGVSRNQLGSWVDAESWHRWATSALDHLRRTFGPDATHCKHFERIYSRNSPGQQELEAARGVFDAARSDYSRGYLFSTQAAITGEILGDLVGLAKAALDGGQVHVAGVLASAALEDALKRFASREGLSVESASMTEVVSALKAKGLVGGAQKTILESMPKLRDWAMHANWDRLTAEAVGGQLGFVERFLLEHF